LRNPHSGGSMSKESTEEKIKCEHLWVRRREGSWCAYCGECRFGVELNKDERERLRQLREKSS